MDDLFGAVTATDFLGNNNKNVLDVMIDTHFMEALHLSLDELEEMFKLPIDDQDILIDYIMGKLKFKDKRQVVRILDKLRNK